MSRLFITISGHGYGHLVQTANVLNALARRSSDLQLIIQCPLPREIIASRLDSGFVHLREHTDPGMLMADPMTTEVDASLEAHVEFHRTWKQRIRKQRALYQQHKPDLLLSNIACMPLAAAREHGLPCIALCSLNWLDILRGYVGTNPEFRHIAPEMEAAYASADVFLTPEPSMPMNVGCKLQPVPVIAKRGKNQRQMLLKRLALADRSRLILVSYGGIQFDTEAPNLPELPNTHYLMQPGYPLQGGHCHSLSNLDIEFTDLIRSVDAVITKPGYGMVTEAVCNKTALLYVPRGDWPEEPTLLDWLHRHGRAMAVDRETLQRGDFGDQLDRVLKQPEIGYDCADGADTAADILFQRLGLGHTFTPPARATIDPQ